MKQKLLRIQFLYDNVKGGAETIAQHIAQERKKDFNIIFYFKGFSFYLFSSGIQRKIKRNKILSILINIEFLLYPIFTIVILLRFYFHF